MKNLVKKMLTLVVSLPLLMPNVVRTGAASGTPHTQTVYAVNDGVSAMTGHTILQNANAETEYYYIDGTPAYCLDHGAHAGGNNGSADLTVYEVFSASDAVAGGTYSQAISSSSNAGTLNYTHTYGTRDMAILSYIVEHGEHSGRGMAVTQMAMWLYSSAQSNIADRIESDVNRAGQIGVEGRALYNAAVAYANAGGMPTKNVKIYSSGNAWYQTFTTFTDEPMVGSVEILKKNSKPEMTEGNDNYAQSMEGAVYELRGANGLTVATLTTDANGYAKAEGIPAGNYTLVEVKAPKGFEVSVEQKPVTVTGALTHVDVFDKPLNDPVNIRLTKISEDLVENPASMEGAEFTVRFYAGQYTKETLPASATRTWVIKTLKKGDKYVTRLGEEYKVSGDEFYLDNDLPTLPLGTVTVEETKAPKGYTLKNKTLNANNEKIADGVALFNIVNDEGTNIPRLDGGNEYSIEEGVERGTFKFAKTDKATGEALVGGKFKIVNMNDYDVVLKNADGSVAETIIAGAESTFEFSADENGTFTGWDNMLQVGNYAIREVEAPVNYHIASNVEFTVNKDEVAPVAMKDEEKTPELKTVAVEDGTNSKLVAENQVRLKDTAEYQNVKPGEYNYTTTVIAKGETEADDVVVSKETKKVTLTEYSGTLEAFADIDTSELGGKELVFFEELDRIEKIEGHNYDVSHKDRNDEGQTVKVTKIRTEATDDVDGDHWLDGTKEVQNFTDKVMYRNLTPGKQYTTTATLMNYETGKPLLIDGKEVTKTVTFTPTEPNGTVLVPFEVSGIKLAGKKYVVFEDVNDENGIRVGMHHDLEDIGQTMKVTMKVGIKVVKIDSQNKERKLEGAEFTVFNKDGSVATDKSGKKLVATTDKNGEVKFSIDFDLDNIMYVQETKAPEGYKLNDTKHEIKPGEDYKVENDIIFTVENTLIPVEKTNDFGIALFAVAGIASLAGIAYILIKNKKGKE